MSEYTHFIEVLERAPKLTAFREGRKNWLALATYFVMQMKALSQVDTPEDKLLEWMSAHREGELTPDEKVAVMMVLHEEMPGGTASAKWN
jgi:hypothetical protein